jgi:hypothetical protein
MAAGVAEVPADLVRTSSRRSPAPISCTTAERSPHSQPCAYVARRPWDTTMKPHGSRAVGLRRWWGHRSVDVIARANSASHPVAVPPSPDPDACASSRARSQVAPVQRTRRPGATEHRVAVSGHGTTGRPLGAESVNAMGGHCLLVPMQGARSRRLTPRVPEHCPGPAARDTGSPAATGSSAVGVLGQRGLPDGGRSPAVDSEHVGVRGAVCVPPAHRPGVRLVLFSGRRANGFAGSRQLASSPP